MPLPTEYANTDFDLESATAFDTLAQELDKSCCLLHYSQSETSLWQATIEANHSEETHNHNAETDILAILAAISHLSPTAQAELKACNLREFNLGFHCANTWAYIHQIPAPVIAAIAHADCSLAVTLYPTGDSDGQRHNEATTQ